MKGILLFSYSLVCERKALPLFYEYLFHGKIPPGYIEKKKLEYAAFGLTDSLTHYTQAIARSLEAATGIRVYIGCKHTLPFVEDAMEQIIQDGVTELYMLALTPLISKTGTISYEQKVQKIINQQAPHIRAVSLNGYSTEEQFISLLVQRMEEALHYIEHPQPKLLFTAHSLPGTEQTNRDFIAQYERLAKAMINRLSKNYAYRLAYRSAGPDTQKWLRPDILTVLEEEHRQGTEAVVVCELLSVVENMEVLSEIGQQAKQEALTKGMEFIQVRYLNDSFEFMQFLRARVEGFSV